MSRAAAEMHRYLESITPAVPRTPPCRCGAYSFPHRSARQCDEFEQAQEQQRYYDEQHRRDLSAWAALSRG